MNYFGTGRQSCCWLRRSRSCRWRDFRHFLVASGQERDPCENCNKNEMKRIFLLDFISSAMDIAVSNLVFRCGKRCSGLAQTCQRQSRDICLRGRRNQQRRMEVCPGDSVERESAWPFTTMANTEQEQPSRLRLRAAAAILHLNFHKARIDWRAVTGPCTAG